MLLTWAPECLRSAGLQVVETSGWTSRSHGAFPDSISGIWHHDASPPGDSPGSLNWMIDNWNNASANFWVNRQGVWYCVGVGVAWHAGSVLSGMPGNYNAFGVETDQTVNEVPSQAMLNSTRRGMAALLKRMGRNAQSLHFHKTVASPVGRKQDPWFDNSSNNQGNWQSELSRERNNVQAIMDGGTSGGGDDEVTDDDINKIADRVWGKMLTSKVNKATMPASEFLLYLDQNTQQDPLASVVAAKVWGYLVTSMVTNEQSTVVDLIRWIDKHVQTGDIVAAVWNHLQTSKVTDQPVGMADMIAYIDKHTAPPATLKA